MSQGSGLWTGFGIGNQRHEDILYWNLSPYDLESVCYSPRPVDSSTGVCPLHFEAVAEESAADKGPGGARYRWHGSCLCLPESCSGFAGEPNTLRKRICRLLPVPWATVVFSRENCSTTILFSTFWNSVFIFAFSLLLWDGADHHSEKRQQFLPREAGRGVRQHDRSLRQAAWRARRYHVNSWDTRFYLTGLWKNPGASLRGLRFVEGVYLTCKRTALCTAQPFVLHYRTQS